MEDYLDEKALARLPGRKYAQSETPPREERGSSEASEAPREEAEDVDGTGSERS